MEVACAATGQSGGLARCGWERLYCLWGHRPPTCGRMLPLRDRACCGLGWGEDFGGGREPAIATVPPSRPTPLAAFAACLSGWQGLCHCWAPLWMSPVRSQPALPGNPELAAGRRMSGPTTGECRCAGSSPGVRPRQPSSLAILITSCLMMSHPPPAGTMNLILAHLMECGGFLVYKVLAIQNVHFQKKLKIKMNGAQSVALPFVQE